jgi:Family of unknown function (DUF5320)
MPFGDRRVPLGSGPGTGRTMGFCAGFSAPGPMNPVTGRGWFGSDRGFGCFGRGRGWRNLFRATGLPGWASAGYGHIPLAGVGHPSGPEFAAKDEVDILKDHADFFKQRLDDIQRRISALEKAKTQERA